MTREDRRREDARTAAAVAIVAKERDEAQEAARYCFRYMRHGWPEGAAKLAEKHPWITGDEP